MNDLAKSRTSAASLYPIYMLVVLVVAYVLAFVDRPILSLLVEPLKRDLHLSDLQISFLQGLSFAIFLSLSGLPIGRLVDTRRRTWVLATGVAVWSVMTGLCGVARTFGPLLLCRIGVGVGEATMTPSAYSLIGDTFKGRRLGMAMGVYGVGPYLGSGLALMLGGYVIRRLPPLLHLQGLGVVHGWQAIFLALGPIGLVVALWIASLREPPRSDLGTQATPTWPSILAYFKHNAAALLCVNLAVTFSAMAMYSLSAWSPSFLVRTYHMKVSEAGQALGWRTIVFGAVGALAAGLIGDALRRRGWPFGRLAVLITAALCAAPLAALMALCGSQFEALNLFGPLVFFLTLAIGSGPATLQEITPNRMRGVQHALAVLIGNLLGLGLGPTIVAFVTDAAFHDETKLGLALASTLPMMLILSAITGGLALAPYARSLAARPASAG